MKNGGVYEFGPYRLDESERTLTCGGSPVSIKPKEFDTLLYLVSHAGRTVAREELIKAVWPDTFVEDGNLNYNISQLRRILGENAQDTSYIQTLPKRGYRFIAVDEGDNARKGDATVLKRESSTLIWVIALTGLVGVAALALMAGYFIRPAEPARVKFQVTLPSKAVLSPASPPAISPDGRRLAFTASTDRSWEIWVRDLDSVALHRLSVGRQPFWSPDSHFIAFFSDGKLKKIDPSGGSPLDVCNSPNAVSGSWSGNEVIVFGTGSGLLYRVSAAGGNPTVIAAAPGIYRRAPWFLPDGRHFLYSVSKSSDATKIGIYVGDLGSNDSKLILEKNSNAVYASPRYLLFVEGRRLMAERFDTRSFRTSGEAVPIAEGLDFYSGAQGQFSSSQNGVLTYATGDSGLNVQLTWMERSGKISGTVGAPGKLVTPAVSPDGRTVAYSRQDSQTGLFDLWLYDVRRGTASRFTSDSKDYWYPVWSPDSKRILFRSNREGGIYQKAVDGNAPEEPFDVDQRSKRVDDWSRDGRYIIEETSDPKTKHDLWVLPLFGDRKLVPYLRTEFEEEYGRLSPDGKWLAYLSNETGRTQVYVRAFPSATQRRQISVTGGVLPSWSPNGRELYYLTGSEKAVDTWNMMSVTIKTEPRFEAGIPAAIFDVRLAPNAWFDVSRDGRFLIPVRADSPDPPITVVVNWASALKR